MENMTPSEPITEGQIGKITAVLFSKLRKQKNQLPFYLVQQVLENSTDSIAEKFFTVICESVEVIRSMIIRNVKVNRNQTSKQVLNATGKKQYIFLDVVENMPKCEHEQAEVIFFKVGRKISDYELEKEYELRGLKPADPYSQAKVNEDDPAFADNYPNGTHWKNDQGKWCFCLFTLDVPNQVNTGIVCVNSHEIYWDDYWWFAGVRK